MDPCRPKSCCSSSFSSSQTQDVVVNAASGEMCHSLSQSASSAIVSDHGSFSDGRGVHAESFPSDSSSQNGYALKEQDYIGLAEVCSSKSDNECVDGYAKWLNTDLHLGFAPLTAKGNINQSKVQAPPLELGLKLDAERAPPMSANVQMAFMNVFSPTQTTPKNGVKRSYLNISLRENLSDATMAHSMSMNNAKQSPGCQPNTLTEHPQNRFLSKWTLPKNHELDQMESPPAKERVVGWPPIRSYRKNSFSTANPARFANDCEGRSNIYVKVNMDGIPIGRKVDLNAYHSYKSLSTALEEMFYSPNSGHGIHFLSDSEFVLTYEDKEGDWMLVGDVPWGMFVGAVKRLRIVRPLEAVGVAPRAPKLPA